ncbi:hypothetical protein D3C77_434860 [compost metagenome]
MRVGDVVQHQVHPADAGHGTVVIQADEIGSVVDSGVLLRCCRSAIGTMWSAVPFEHEVFLR